ncbi:hypothetical protein C7M61_004775 [Candidozyma pseudohaemuli]|uniref:Major facilitator superfamily (MFS) profile domain-containing protein n=1 Tax=Candidozyma pseudohaemuli TaxID=418784 RepID=A0A2P7YGM8_9ASCO|nr:hypothetical protein C7M61_004775 [[Candida] pseudohaemulonii]PSK35113.1 hypothetical protein C7M61_004775 [[Candida] pseudohaemulonii]
MIFSRDPESSSQIDIVTRGDFKLSPKRSDGQARPQHETIGSPGSATLASPTSEGQGPFSEPTHTPAQSFISADVPDGAASPQRTSEESYLSIATNNFNDSSLESTDSKKGNETPQPKPTARDLDWDGPDDKANPQNWPALKKWFITFTVALDCLCVSLGSSLYVEAVPDLMIEMGVSQTLGISGLTFYLIGLALGPVLAAPVSEIIGRRWIYIVSLPMGMLFTMGVGLAKNIRTILVLRFFSGFFNSPPMSVAGGTVSDLWSNDPAQLAVAMALFCLAPFLGPIIGPIVGGFAVDNHSWEWTQWVLLIFCGGIMPLLVLCPETLKPAILKKRAIKRGIELDKPKMDLALLKKIATIFLFRPVEMLIVEPIVCLTSVYIAFVFAVLFGFFQAYPIIFRGIYEMNRGVSGLPFIGVGVGLIIGVLGFIQFDHTFFHPKNEDGSRVKRDENGEPIELAPESRLAVAVIGSVFLPIALFWLAWTSRESIHWIAPTLAGVPFGFGLIWVFFGIVLYYSMTYPPQCLASALAANNVLRYSLASVFPLFIFDMYEELEVDWATSVFAFIALVMVPIPFVFYKFGHKLRLKSKYSFEAEAKRLAAEKEDEDSQEAFEFKFNETGSIRSEPNEGAGSPFVPSTRTMTEADDMVANKA